MGEIAAQCLLLESQQSTQELPAHNGTLSAQCHVDIESGASLAKVLLRVLQHEEVGRWDLEAVGN